MKIETIPVDKIDVAKDRSRPTTEQKVIELASDIQERGLRYPIEVFVQKGGRFRLITGGHRLAACKFLGHEQIQASIVKGNRLELKRDELMENLARNHLSALEYAQSVAELKRIHMQLHGARHGGDRKSKNAAGTKSSSEVRNLISWYDTASKASGHSKSVVYSYAAIGENLSPEAADRLRGTPFADNQQQLNLLCKLDPDMQYRVAELLATENEPAKSVTEARDIVEGRFSAASEGTKADKWLVKFKSDWARCPNKRCQRDALNWLAELGVIPELHAEAAE